MAKKQVVKKSTTKKGAKLSTNSRKKVKRSVSTKKSKTLAKAVNSVDELVNEQVDDIDTLLADEPTVEDEHDGVVTAEDEDDYEFFGDDDTVYPAD